jgi:hypothetical protein
MATNDYVEGLKRGRLIEVDFRIRDLMFELKAAKKNREEILKELDDLKR